MQPDERRPLTPAEQERQYQQRWTEYQNALRDWEDRGKLGPPPPRPVAPHIPGWLTPTESGEDHG